MPTVFHLAVLGDPVSHSRSPAIHTVALGLAGLTGEYRAIKADRARLEQTIQDLHSEGLQGVNITMPLKGDAWELVDETTAEGESAASVNTLRQRMGVIQGHSSDVVAFREVASMRVLADIENVLVLGGGGAARAALGVLEGPNVYLSTRSATKADRLAEEFDIAGTIRWGASIAGALVVNTTPLGMDLERLPDGVLDVSAGLVDLPYGSRPTPAVATALERGMPVVDGLEFLARQARESFRWWTGVTVDLGPLTEAARNI